MNKLRIGVIVHGPGIVDSGYAKKIIGLLENYGVVSCKLGGTMGRTAVIDANLENVINIEDKLLPSQSINVLSKNNDVLFLLNYGKSNITGHTFGYKVISKVPNNLNIVQIERPGESDGCIINWSDKKYNDLISSIANDLKLPVISSNHAIALVENLTGFIEEDNIVKRKVAGVSPNENIMINGIIVGKSLSNELVIISENNKIIEIEGGIIKQHGIDKLGDVNLSKAIIKTGLLRNSADIKPRSIIHENNSQLKAAFLNHSAEDIYKYNGVDVLVSIGDDTTLLSSDILYRFNIPIIGITDGDLDKIVLKGFKLKKSIIIQVESGYDDVVGNLIHEEIFDNNLLLNIDSISKLKSDIISLIKSNKINYSLVDKQLA